MFNSQKIIRLEMELSKAEYLVMELREVNKELRETEIKYYDLISSMSRKDRLKSASLETLLTVASELHIQVTVDCDKADIIKDILDCEQRIEKI